MIRRVDVSVAARLDILEIADYLGERSDDARLRFLTESEDCQRALIKYPNHGRVVKPSRAGRAPLRSCYVSSRFRNYLVYYRVFANSVRIVRVLHGARNVRAILRLTE